MAAVAAQVVHWVDRDQVLERVAPVVGVAEFVVGGVFLDPGVGGGGFSEGGAEQAGESFEFDAAEPGRQVGGEVVFAEHRGEMGELVLMFGHVGTPL